MLDGPAGFKALVGTFDLAGADALRSRLAHTHLKAYPVCYHGQSPVDAAMQLAGRVPPEEIARVHVETHEVAFAAMAGDPSRWAPPNRETADHSIPYVVGHVLATGGLPPEAYAPDRLRDPRLLALLRRIEVAPRAEFTAGYPAEACARITLETRGGSSPPRFRRFPAPMPGSAASCCGPRRSPEATTPPAAAAWPSPRCCRGSPPGAAAMTMKPHPAPRRQSRS
ncbi:MmgE/PrpD family protein [Mangrovicoccus ximenensis]|uniref:MmgE/PrpD family protein n=1 Tax=Mangrovicoccus ximenensis TaxID=1911570 RepID=UPI000D388161|nr:MmgE/PrpD family protein [Mangrovicoccus ximenensis]